MYISLSLCDLESNFEIEKWKCYSERDLKFGRILLEYTISLTYNLKIEPFVPTDEISERICMTGAL